MSDLCMADQKELLAREVSHGPWTDFSEMSSNEKGIA